MCLCCPIGTKEQSAAVFHSLCSMVLSLMEEPKLKVMEGTIRRVFNGFNCFFKMIGYSNALSDVQTLYNLYLDV